MPLLILKCHQNCIWKLLDFKIDMQIFAEALIWYICSLTGAHDPQRSPLYPRRDSSPPPDDVEVGVENVVAAEGGVVGDGGEGEVVRAAEEEGEGDEGTDDDEEEALLTEEEEREDGLLQGLRGRGGRRREEGF